jgi:large subunit ribosomal protein L4
MLMNIYNFLNKDLVGTSDVNLDNIMDVQVNDKLIQEHFVKMKKYHIIPTAHTKCVAEISATTKKPFNQKGTGRARQGTTIAPQHRGGVKIFGPQGIKAHIGLPKKETRLVKKMLIKIAIETGKLMIVNDCKIPDSKTKNACNTLDSFGIKKGHTIVLHDNEVNNDNILSARNLKWFSYSRVSDFTVYNLIKSELVIVTKSAINKLSEF